jgi:hypothetical protein
MLSCLENIPQMCDLAYAGGAILGDGRCVVVYGGAEDCVCRYSNLIIEVSFNNLFFSCPIIQV